MPSLAKYIKMAEEASRNRWVITTGPTNRVYYVVFYPPEETPYSSGTFLAEITFPTNYPTYPPRVRMITKIFHPNFSNRAGHIGNMYSEKLYGDYTMTFTLTKLLDYMWGLFKEPDTDPLSVCNPKAGNVWFKSREVYNTIAQEWTELHAQ